MIRGEIDDRNIDNNSKNEDTTMEWPIRNQHAESEWKEQEKKENWINMGIPNADEVASSPELVFGENTINMIDEFMEKEVETKRGKKGFRRIIEMLVCCRYRNKSK